jgi:hypothetical protein
MMTGDGDKGSYKRNGFDGGTRFRSPVITTCLMTSVGLTTTNWASIFRRSSTGITTMQRCPRHHAPYALYRSEKQNLGTLTYGQQNSIYYDVVGAKTDIWDYDMIAQAPGTVLTATMTDLIVHAIC